MIYGGGIYGVCVVYIILVYVCLWCTGLCMCRWCGGGLCIGLCKVNDVFVCLLYDGGSICVIMVCVFIV